MSITILKHGIYDSVEYIPAGSWNQSKATVIKFADGSTYVINGEYYDIPHPKGTHIFVMLDKWLWMTMGIYITKAKEEEMKGEGK